MFRIVDSVPPRHVTGVGPYRTGGDNESTSQIINELLQAAAREDLSKMRRLSESLVTTIEGGTDISNETVVSAQDALLYAHATCAAVAGPQGRWKVAFAGIGAFATLGLVLLSVGISPLAPAIGAVALWGWDVISTRWANAAFDIASQLVRLQGVRGDAIAESVFQAKTMLEDGKKLAEVSKASALETRRTLEKMTKQLEEVEARRTEAEARAERRIRRLERLLSRSGIRVPDLQQLGSDVEGEQLDAEVHHVDDMESKGDD